MFIRHSSMACAQEGRPLGVGLEGTHDLNCCEGKVLYDYKNVVLLPHTYDNGFFYLFFNWGQITLVYFYYPL